MRCAVLGDPVAHSLSPVLHRAGYAALGLDWTYEAHRVPAGGLAGFLAGLDAAWRGLSLTMPLKREAVALATSLSEVAQRVGAANTLVREADGWHGHNTDVPGAVAAMQERGLTTLDEVTILGGGATAASVALAAADLGATCVRLLVRAPDRAAETARVIASHPGVVEVVVGLLDDPVRGDLLVSTVPAVAQDTHLVARCADVPAVFEVLYDPWPTPLAASAADRLLVGGLDLLVHQAAWQFELFTGSSVPVESLRAAGETALAERWIG